MTKYLPLIFLFLVSCASLPADLGPGNGAQATPADQVQASPMPSQMAQLATPAPTSDAVSTQMALIHALETKQAEVNLLQQQSRQADVAIANANASAAAASAESEKYKAAQADAVARQKQADAQLAAAQADQANADNQAKQLALQAEQAAADEARARTNQIMIVSLVAVLAIGTIALLRIVSLRTRQFEASIPATPNIFDTAPAATKPLERPVIPQPDGSLNLDTNPPGDPVKFSEFASYALGGAPLGITNVVGAGVYSSNTQYIPVLEFMRKTQRLAPMKSGATGLSKTGEEFCKLWLRMHPLPAPGSAPNVAENNHDYDSHDHELGGGVA